MFSKKVAKFDKNFTFDLTLITYVKFRVKIFFSIFVAVLENMNFTGLENKAPLKVLNGTKLIIDDHVNNLDSFRISLKSFLLLLKPVTGQELFFAISYSKMALAHDVCFVYLTG